MVFYSLFPTPDCLRPGNERHLRFAQKTSKVPIFKLSDFVMLGQRPTQRVADHHLDNPAVCTVMGSDIVFEA